MKWQRIAAVALPLVRCSGAGHSSADEFMLALWEKGFPASSKEFKVVEIATAPFKEDRVPTAFRSIHSSLLLSFHD